MRTDLDHLPVAKQRELERVRRILFEEFDDAIRLGTQAWKKQGRILKMILYGSYARGDWIHDPVGGYVSDYDLLVVVNHDRLTDTLEYWAKADDHLLREYSVTHRLTAPASFIVHSIADVNTQLQRGRPFFVDIVRDGIALYEMEGHDLEPPKPLSPDEQRKEAKNNFDYWFEQASSARMGADFYVANGKSRDAAFLFHQAAERLYHCALLTLTLYSPKSHKLNFLRSQAESHDLRLIEAWPRGTRFGQRCFELLRRAYVEARYSPHYKIRPEELKWIGERIAVLQELVRAACEERLAALEQRSVA
ncbi:HEPN domain-containing protein [Sphingomonas sp. ID1715]|nr:nucleotidyltransferase and HEPN domain-containing protein [Sphingomonas sp. ID1715]NNM77749.1 HEPN domain-containing protein [Sphingomonas sp. ID1715]